MAILITAVLNLGLLLAVLLSAQLAVAWGELGSHPLTGDKSGMDGFAMVIILMPLRWLLIAAGLVVGIVRGSYGELPGSPWLRLAVVLGLHLLLGIAAYQVFEWICRAVRDGHPGPQRVAIVFGLILPSILWLVAFVGVNRPWLVRHWLIGSVVAGLALWAQVAAWRQGYVRPVPTGPSTPIQPSAGDTFK